MKAAKMTYGRVILFQKDRQFSLIPGTDFLNLMAGLFTVFAERFLLHDPRIWSEPNVFKPERFLDPVQEGTFDPQSVIYGFGRRYDCSISSASRILSRTKIICQDLSWEVLKRSERVQCGRFHTLGSQN